MEVLLEDGAGAGTAARHEPAQRSPVGTGLGVGRAADRAHLRHPHPVPGGLHRPGRPGARQDAGPRPPRHPHLLPGDGDGG
ncbi:MAG: hypothetical protein AN484_27355, partial [Aphanizomenon flos-aquae WA102]